ncbi:glutathione S-transferase theta-1-like [Aplochiton taeniatus]
MNVFVTGQHYGEDFGKVSLVRKVPVMKDGDFVPTENVAILKYMAEKCASSVPDHCICGTWPVGTGLDVFEGRPTLSAWRDRVKREIGEDLFDEAHKTIMHVDGLPQTFEKIGMPDFLKPCVLKNPTNPV